MVEGVEELLVGYLDEGAPLAKSLGHGAGDHVLDEVSVDGDVY